MQREGLPQLGQRRSGILLHLTSLPGPWGCGDLGDEALHFADLLEEAGQSWWQMLPVGPAGFGNCPYMASSAFALSPQLLSGEALCRAGLLAPADLRPDFSVLPGRVDFDALNRFQEPRWNKASAAFFSRSSGEELDAFREFCREESDWLADYALFCALKEQTGGASWTAWEGGVRGRDPEALSAARERLRGRCEHHAYLQFELARQWDRLRRRCRLRGIGLIGDIPIFVAHESADVWAHPDLFDLDELGRPRVVAGVPPDYFSREGQRWGHPLYRWPALRERGYHWWIRRFQRTLTLFDAVRCDHFIGYHRVWEIPASCPTAVEGRWVPGPGREFLDELLRRLGRAPIIAEDLGLVTPEVVALRDRYHFPGMRVLQFAFGGDPRHNPHLPHLYQNPTVVYTGTHDNDTTAGWYADLLRRAGDQPAGDGEKELEFLRRYLNSKGREIHWDLIRLALASVADLAIIPAQDLLGIGSEGRMNMPAAAGGNWEWRLAKGALHPRVLKRLRLLTEDFGRLPDEQGSSPSG